MTTVQLMLADAAATRGEAVGVYAPTMTMAKELARLFAAEVAPPSQVAKATAFAVDYDAGGAWCSRGRWTHRPAHPKRVRRLAQEE